jgi:hypothetical protein
MRSGLNPNDGMTNDEATAPSSPASDIRHSVIRHLSFGRPADLPFATGAIDFLRFGPLPA